MLVYESKLAFHEVAFNERQTEWREFKKAVRKSHWRKSFSAHDKYILNNNGWEILKELEKLEHKVQFFGHKTLYYGLIFSSKGRPSKEIIDHKNSADKILQEFPYLFAI